VTVFGALTSAAGALAAISDREQHKFNSDDQAAAKTAVVLKSDLQNTGWTGGAKKPDLSPAPTCANFDPKQSDLVLTGAAETDWKHANLELDTVAQVLQSADMVEKDWQRTVADPASFSCTKTYVKKNLGGSANERFVSMTRVPFPAVGTHARAYITRIDVTSNGKTAPVLIEDVLLTTGRTEISLSSTTAGPYAVAVADADIALARALVHRARA
jgi:hypothetical protein